MQTNRTVAIVTGGGRGIGAAAAERLASGGTQVVLVARNGTEVQHVAAGIKSAGGDVLALPADVSESGAANTIVRAAEAHFNQPCQILVNAAGITGPVSELADLCLASFRHVIEVNLIGALHLSQAVLPSMKQSGWGRIVNVTSGLGRRIQSGLGAYSTTKAALTHMSQIMDAEAREHGVRVFALEPGVVRSRMSDHLRSLEPTGFRAGIVQMVEKIERDLGLIEATESARLVYLTATGQADDLADGPFSIYDPNIRARIASI